MAKKAAAGVGGADISEIKRVLVPSDSPFEGRVIGGSSKIHTVSGQRAARLPLVISRPIRCRLWSLFSVGGKR